MITILTPRSVENKLNQTAYLKHEFKTFKSVYIIVDSNAIYKEIEKFSLLVKMQYTRIESNELVIPIKK